MYLFDPRAAKLLKPGEHLTVKGCPGLRLVASNSRKSWIYRYKDAAGRMKQIALGATFQSTDKAASFAEVVRLWEAKKALLAAGTDPVKEKRAAQAEAKKAAVAMKTVRDLVEAYANGPLQDDRKAEGAEAAKRALLRALDDNPSFAASDIGDVTRAACYAVLDGRKDTPTAAAKLRGLMGSAWEHAIDAGRISDNTPNWWRELMRGKLKSKGKIVAGEHQGRQRRVLQGHEVGVLIPWLENMHALGRDMATIYLWTAARGVEVSALRPEFITKEADGWWWTIPKPQTKNARHEDAVDHRVPLFGRALEVVRRRMESVGVSGLLFEDERQEQYTQHDFSTYVYDLQPYSKKAQRRQGEGLVLPVTHWTPHNLRRTSRTLLASLGCPNEIGEQIVGHMPETIIGTYNAYTYDKEKRLWLGKLDRHLEELAAQSLGLPRRP